MFNGRRLSRDSVLCDRLWEESGRRLRVGPGSAELFGDGTHAVRPGVCVGADWLSGAGPDDTCFVEDPADLAGLRPDGVLVFRWNRTYPYDKAAPDWLLDGMYLERLEELHGSSHDKITMEVFARERA